MCAKAQLAATGVAMVNKSCKIKRVEINFAQTFVPAIPNQMVNQKPANHAVQPVQNV